MTNKIKNIFTALEKMYPNPQSELNYTTPFQLMMAVILSAQTTDKQVNKVTENIFNIVKNPKDLLDFGEKKLEKSISGVNYYKTKARNLWKLAGILNKTPLITPPTPSKIEWALQKLQELPGIGIKTAKVIAHVLRDLPVIAVDTHVHRVANRWGIVNTTTPEKTSEMLEKVVPEKYKNFAHHVMVLFGRYECLARKPKCETCPLQKYCNFYKNK